MTFEKVLKPTAVNAINKEGITEENLDEEKILDKIKKLKWISSTTKKNRLRKTSCVRISSIHGFDPEISVSILIII
jgi:hypothetical protein